MSTNDDLLGDIPEQQPLTQADYDRAAKLDAGIKALSEELNDLKARIKAEHKEKGTFEHGNVTVVVGERQDKDWESTAEHFPQADFPHMWENVPTFLRDEVPAKYVMKKDPIQTLSIKIS